MAARGESGAALPAAVKRRFELRYRLVVPASRQYHQIFLPVPGFARRLLPPFARSARYGEEKSLSAFLARIAGAVRGIHSWSEL